MQALGAEQLLAAWDRGVGQHDLDRALTLLCIGHADVSRDELAALSIAERNLLLLRLRQLTFGAQLEGVASCEQCGAVMEFSLPVTGLIADLELQRGAGFVEWEQGGRRMRLREVTSVDLIASLNESSPDAAEESVLRRCVHADSAGPDIDVTELTRLPSIRSSFDRLHEAAELRCVLTCPQCQQSATLDLDIANFLWLEVRHAAKRLIEDIHLLASHYGWSEADILRMSPRRRDAYLEMLRA